MADDLDAIPQNTNHRLSPSYAPTHRLTLTSYSHRRGPLVPPPTSGLLFDVRALPNPPKRLRDVYVGTDKALCTALMAEGRCRERVQEIETIVRGVLAQHGGVVGRGRNEEESESEEEDEGKEEREEEPHVHIRVGICCEMGRHRSVACVEELARVAWPAGWDVEVVHRDLTRPRSERDKEKRAKRVERVDSESD